MQRAQIIVLITAIALLIFVLEQVRRRRLREEYSWLWLGATVFYLLTAMIPGMSQWIADLIGTNNSALTFTFLGLQFVVVILISYSVRFSQLTDQVKNLAQQISILDGEIKKLQKSISNEDSRDDAEFDQVDEQARMLSDQLEVLNNEVNNVQENYKLSNSEADL